MNKTQQKYLDKFKVRLADLNIIEGVDYTVEIFTNSVNFECKFDGNNQLRSTRNTHCIMGMIYHFSNRKWITDFGYMYIMKSIQTIVFNDGTTETN